MAVAAATGATPSSLILLPTLDEEAGLDLTLGELERVGRFPGRTPPKLLVVDGGSTDGTRDVAAHHGVEVLLQTGRGKGAAVRDGLDWARRHGYATVGVLDADGTYPCDRLPALFGLLDGGADVVIGVRRPNRPADSTARDLVHRIGNVALNLSAATLSRGPLLDVCSGFWGVRTAIVPGLRLESDGFEIESELFVKAARHRLQIVQIPIEYRDRVGTAKLHAVRDGLRIFLSIVRHSFRGRSRPASDGRSLSGPGAVGAVPAPTPLQDVRTLLLALGPPPVVVVSPLQRYPDAADLARTLRPFGRGVEVVSDDSVGPSPRSAATMPPELGALASLDDGRGAVVTLPWEADATTWSAPIAVDLPRQRRRLLVPRPVRHRRSIRSTVAASLLGPRSRRHRLGTLTLLSASLERSGVRKLEALIAANLFATTLAADPTTRAPASMRARSSGRRPFTLDPGFRAGQRW